jgi:HEAT repeat protein
MLRSNGSNNGKRKNKGPPMTRFLLCALVFTIITSATTQGFAQRMTTSDYKHLLLKEVDKARGCPSENILRSISPRVDSFVVDMLNNRKLSLWRRMAAVDCLAHFANKRSKQVLSSLISDPTWDQNFQHRAMISAAKAFGEEFYPQIMQKAQSKNPSTRAAAVKALGILATQQAVMSLKSLQDTELDMEVIRAIDEALRQNKGSVQYIN